MTSHDIPTHDTGHDTGDNTHGQGAHVQDSSGPAAQTGVASLGVLRAEAVRVLTAACRAKRPATGRGCATTAGGPVDFAGFVASVLASVAANVGSTARLTAGRPGSWEADLVSRLVAGTVGDDDAHVFAYRTQPVVVPLNVLDLAWDLDGFPNHETALEAALDTPFVTDTDPCLCGGDHISAWHPEHPGIPPDDEDDEDALRADVMADAAFQAVQAAVHDAYAGVYAEYARRFTAAVHAAAAGVPGLTETLAAVGAQVAVAAVHDPWAGAEEVRAVADLTVAVDDDLLVAHLREAALAALPVPAAPVLPAVADIARPAVTAALAELRAEQAEQVTGGDVRPHDGGDGGDGVSRPGGVRIDAGQAPACGAGSGETSAGAPGGTGGGSTPPSACEEGERA